MFTRKVHVKVEKVKMIKKSMLYIICDQNKTDKFEIKQFLQNRYT